jgi:hypothetical protein
LSEESEDRTRFLHYIIFRDAAAEERHAVPEGVKRFTAVLHPECLEPVEFRRYEVVASTGALPVAIRA